MATAAPHNYNITMSKVRKKLFFCTTGAKGNRSRPAGRTYAIKCVTCEVRGPAHDAPGGAGEWGQAMGKLKNSVFRKIVLVRLRKI